MDADVWDAIAVAQPEYFAFVQGYRERSWGDFAARADALAAHLVDAGLAEQSKVAAYLHNGALSADAWLFRCRTRRSGRRRTR